MDFSNIDVRDHQILARVILKEAIAASVADRRAFQKLRNKITKREHAVTFHNLYFVKAYEDMVAAGEIDENPGLLKLIKKRSVRTASGVAPVTVMTKAWPCPGKCVYCPTDVRMPKSYIATQPAAARGLRQKFDPYKQVVVRLRALEMTGHEVSKVELRIIGGTWSSYDVSYQRWFVFRCLSALSDWSSISARSSQFPISKLQINSKSEISNSKEDSALKILDEKFEEFVVSDEAFEDEVSRNETADVRCIGINIETRPDCIDADEIARLRWLGVTKIEMGVQTTSDRVQELTMRGHDLAEVRRATRLMKDAGFKVSYHMMPNLPGSTPEQDVEDYRVLFGGDEYQPDYLKIYPCMVIPKTTLSEYMGRKVDELSFSDERLEVGGQRAEVRGQNSEIRDNTLEGSSEGILGSSEDWKLVLSSYQTYSDEVLTDVLMKCKRLVPEYCRIDRLMRDIPADEIQEGSKVSNIRQIVQQELLKEGFTCRCIRCREIGDLESDSKDVELVTREYDASGGREMFLSFEDVKLDKLLGLLRLRFLPPSPLKGEYTNHFASLFGSLPELKGCALVREIHVYGVQRKIENVKSTIKKTLGSQQHVGYGRLLMDAAEERSRKAGYKKIAVIAGIGTREYYKKLGYTLEGTYMLKEL